MKKVDRGSKLRKVAMWGYSIHLFLAPVDFLKQGWPEQITMMQKDIELLLTSRAHFACDFHGVGLFP